jgi:dihydropteroate synthase
MTAKVMGIVNVTPDSFSDGGLFLDPARAISHGLELAAEGADVLDVGGESTRPGARAVSAATELERTRPVVEALAAAGGPPVSIDTSKAEVARTALDSGAAIVNDVTALRADPELGDLCAERDCGLVLMHMLGTPRTMQRDPTYGDVVDEVRAFLAERIEVAVAAGVAEQRIWVDPGIGFGKTVEHNLALLRRIGELRQLGRPIVVGTSRKSFLGAITGRDVDRRLGGSVASNVIALAAGAEVFRVHDVLAARQALDVAETVLGRRAWRRRGAARA